MHADGRWQMGTLLAQNVPREKIAGREIGSAYSFKENFRIASLGDTIVATEIITALRTTQGSHRVSDSAGMHACIQDGHMHSRYISLSQLCLFGGIAPLQYCDGSEYVAFCKQWTDNVCLSPDVAKVPQAAPLTAFVCRKGVFVHDRRVYVQWKAALQ